MQNNTFVGRVCGTCCLVKGAKEVFQVALFSGHLDNISRCCGEHILKFLWQRNFRLGLKFVPSLHVDSVKKHQYYYYCSKQ